MGFPRQEYWSGLPFPSSGESSRPRVWTRCLLQADSSPLSHQGSPVHTNSYNQHWFTIHSHCSLGQPGPLLRGCGISSRWSRSCTSQFRVPFPSPKFPWQVTLMRKIGKDNMNIQLHPLTAMTATELPSAPESSVGKESACNAGDPGLIPGSGRSTGEGIVYPLQYSRASLVARLVNNPPAMRETWVRSLGWEDPLEKGKATTPVFWPGEFHGL